MEAIIPKGQNFNSTILEALYTIHGKVPLTFKQIGQALVTRAFNPITQEAEAGGSL